MSSVWSSQLSSSIVDWLELIGRFRLSLIELRNTLNGKNHIKLKPFGALFKSDLLFICEIKMQ